MDIGGIRAGDRFSERECRDGFPRHDGQVLAFLLLGAEQEQRHGDANGLWHSNGQGENVAPTCYEHEGAPVVRIGESKAPVLFRDFHAERAECEEPFEHGIGNLRRPFDFVGIDVRLQEGLQLQAVFFPDNMLFR